MVNRRQFVRQAAAFGLILGMREMKTHMVRKKCRVLGFWQMWMVALAMIGAGALAQADDADRIRPYRENPFYWQYKGQPVLLLGGSWQDNLFNHPKGLERHLDVLKSVGGNYLRNVMSHRNVGNVFAYEQVNGKFDLDRWNDEYWRRFENFLKLTHARDIVVQIEIWATWDHYNDHQSIGGWSKHPFNPVNNVNYTAEESGLPVAVDYGAGATPTDHKFFHTAPALENNTLVLRYQLAYVDKLLSYSLKYPHVLYCMNNETGEPVAWSDFWARYVRAQAAEAGKPVEVAEMRRNHDITAPDHRHMIDHRDLYSFLDISQNNTQGGQTHWDRMLQVRAWIQDQPRPINNNKIYSGGNDEEAVARMFRIIFAGGASARFHRPHPLEGTDDHEKSTVWGLGLSPRAQATLRAARTLTEAMTVFACEPRNDLLSDRQPNEAYCLAEPGKQYAVYFPDGGLVKLDVSTAKGTLQVRWLDISRNAWQQPQSVTGGGTLELKTPGTGHWAVLVLAR
jgi:hypothetical protein